MSSVCRTNVDSAGGPILSGGNSKVFVNGSLGAVQGCPVQGHGRNEHSGPQIVTGSSKVFFQGIGVCRTGDVASCGHTATGTSNVFAG